MSPDPSSIIDATCVLLPSLAERAGESERLRHVAPASIEAMTRLGLFRLVTPSTHGGLEAGIAAQVETTRLVATADPAAGWVQMVSNAHVWMAGNFPTECQTEVFADGPDVIIPGTLASQGKAVRTDDGWRLTGRWQFASGVDHGDWLLIGAVADSLPESPNRALHVLVPKSDITVDDTWFTLGLRGTGSKDLVADDVFIPAHRAIPTKLLFDGESPHGEHHRTHVNRLPVLVCLGVQFCGAVVGIAQGALDEFVTRTRTRRDTYTGAPKAEDPGIQTRLAESATEVALVAGLTAEMAALCDEVGSTGVRLTPDERAQLKWQCSYVTEVCRRAVERVYAASGAHAVYDDSPIQSRFRDINTAAHHAVVDFDSNARMRGRILLGLDPGTPLL